MGGKPLTEAFDLVAQLESLVDGPAAVLRLVARGREAVEPLRRYLLEGRITSLFQPRRWAVEALTALGARDVLLEYLAHPRSVRDPVLRQSEDAVENAAARALTAWPTEDVFGVLLERARSRPLPGLVEALGAFRRIEAIPILVHALEDDMCRPQAEQSLRALGRVAAPALVRTALSPSPEAGDESPSSLRRRRSAAGLLADGSDTVDWLAVRPLLLEDDPALVVRASRVAARTAPPHDQRLAASRLMELAGTAGSVASVDIEDCLVDLYPQATDLVEQEVARRSMAPIVPPQAPDSTLGLLRRVVSRATGGR
jgi:hypothetical protein